MRYIEFGQYVVIRCKRCSGKRYLHDQDLTKISEKFQINTKQIDYRNLWKFSNLFRCNECGTKFTKLIYQPINQRKSKPKSPTTRKTITKKPVKKPKPKKRKRVGKPKPRRRGFCVKCGDKIPDERLKIMPNTSLCTGCKSAEELWLNS